MIVSMLLLLFSLQNGNIQNHTHLEWLIHLSKVSGYRRLALVGRFSLNIWFSLNIKFEIKWQCYTLFQLNSIKKQLDNTTAFNHNDYGIN